MFFFPNLITHRHRTIRMKPNEVDFDNEQHLLDTVYNYKRLIPSQTSMSTAVAENGKRLNLHGRRATFRVGDHVRLSKYRKLFDKGYTPNWTTEIFKIRKIQHATDPITYLLSDYQNRDIKGSVYAEELQLAKHPDVYLVEKIIRKRNGNAYVKWLGFGSEHNSWVSMRDLI